METYHDEYKGSSPVTTGVLGASGGALVANIATSGVKLLGNDSGDSLIEKMKKTSTSKPALIASTIAAIGVGGHQYLKSKAAINQHADLSEQVEKLQVSNQLHQAQANYANKFGTLNNSHSERVSAESTEQPENSII